ncbi:hypothetical protein HT105_24730, partial [Bacteroides fragilis]|nr:hypothetical protein [Bacteroides fragilis]
EYGLVPEEYGGDTMFVDISAKQDLHIDSLLEAVVVAVNKIDKPEASPEKIRGQLTEYGLVPEEYGGDTMFVDISAKQDLHIDSLLEAV